MNHSRDYEQEFIHRYPYPGNDPVRRLAHVLEVLGDVRDDEMAVTVTREVYGPGIVTGLTYGDLRALANRTFPVTAHTHYVYWKVQEDDGSVLYRTNNTVCDHWDSVQTRWTSSQAESTSDFLDLFPGAIPVEDPRFS